MLKQILIQDRVSTYNKHSHPAYMYKQIGKLIPNQLLLITESFQLFLLSLSIGYHLLELSFTDDFHKCFVKVILHCIATIFELCIIDIYNLRLFIDCLINFQNKFLSI